MLFHFPVLSFFFFLPLPLPCSLPPFLFSFSILNFKIEGLELQSYTQHTNKKKFLSWLSRSSRTPWLGVPIVAQQKQIWLASIRTQVRSLASLNGLRNRCRHSLDLVLLQLCCRAAAIAPIRPLAWEPLYAIGVALKRQKNKAKQKKKPKKNSLGASHTPYDIPTLLLGSPWRDPTVTWVITQSTM